jgi:hypothetical protein
MREEYTRALMAEIDEIETPECRARTPVDTGNLVNTVKTFGPEFRGNQVLAGTTAGGPEAPYAPIVHEDLDAHHRVGQAKFIESVYRESAPYLPARVAARMDMARAFRG